VAYLIEKLKFGVGDPGRPVVAVASGFNAEPDDPFDCG